jgi:hypothetical protein
LCPPLSTSRQTPQRATASLGVKGRPLSKADPTRPSASIDHGKYPANLICKKPSRGYQIILRAIEAAKKHPWEFFLLLRISPDGFAFPSVLGLGTCIWWHFCGTCDLHEMSLQSILTFLSRQIPLRNLQQVVSSLQVEASPSSSSKCSPSDGNKHEANDMMLQIQSGVSTLVRVSVRASSIVHRNWPFRFPMMGNPGRHFRRDSD